jgi:hypothetical protein
MRTSTVASSFAAVLAAISFGHVAIAQNLVANGGFETQPMCAGKR